MLPGVIASLNVAVTALVRTMLVAAFSGVTLLTVGAVVSATVVNVQLKSAARGLPAASLTPLAPLFTVTVYTVRLAKATVGVRVTTRVGASKVTVAGTGVAPGPVSSTVVAPIVPAVIASLNVAATPLPNATSVAALMGVTPPTVGAVVSATVVNVQTRSLASGLPAASLTPLAPLFTVAVYTVRFARGALGVNVAVRVGAS